MSYLNLNLKALITPLSLPLMLTDETFQSFEMNSLAAKLLGLDKPEEKPLSELLGLPEDRLKAILEFLRPNTPCRSKIEYKPSKGKAFPLDLCLHWVPLAPNQSPLILIEIHSPLDSSQFKTRMAQLGTKLADISHSITNPLSVLKISCENMRFKNERQRLWTAKEVEEKIEKFESSTQRLSHKNDELKDISFHMTEQDWDKLDQILESGPSNSPINH